MDSMLEALGPVDPGIAPGLEVEPLPLPRTRRSAGPRPPRVRARPRRPAGPLLPAAPSLFPWIARRLAPGEATLLTGPAAAVEPLLELVYAGSARVGGRVSLLEGANRFHPFRIGERGRALGVDPGEVLERVRLARAFTAYQLVALVDGWAREVRRHRATLLVAHEIPALFYDPDFPEEERRPLLAHVAGRLRALLRETGLPLLVTSTGGLGGFPGLAEDGPSLYDVVALAPRPGGLALEAFHPPERVRLVSRASGQRGLEELAEPGEAEVIAWAARYRPTARRSRSG